MNDIISIKCLNCGKFFDIYKKELEDEVKKWDIIYNKITNEYAINCFDCNYNTMIMMYDIGINFYNWYLDLGKKRYPLFNEMLIAKIL